MIQIKSPQDIKKMREGGRILSQILAKVLENIKPGVMELELEKIANAEIKKRGGSPSFKKVKGYHYALCLSLNDIVVHGIPGNYRFKEGDIVGVDCGVFYKGFNTDMSETLRVPSGQALRVPSGQALRVSSSKQKAISNKDEIDRFLETGRRALFEAIDQAVVGNRIGHISKKIQDIVEGAGYSVVRALVGHGIGKDLHEEPEVPGFLQGKIEDTPLLKAGMTLAIEIIYNIGKSDVKCDKDGWTIRTKDGSISGLFEKTIAVTKKKPLVLN